MVAVPATASDYLAYDHDQGVYRDYHVEQFLQAHVAKELIGFDAEIPLEKLDLHSSLRAQVRPGTKDGVVPALVQKYVTMRRQGLVPPPGIVHDLGNGRYELLDARQRTEAATFVGAKTMAFYILRTDDEAVLWKVAMAANIDLSGEAPSEDDIERQILAYTTQFQNNSNAATAELFKVNEYYVKDVITRAKVGERLVGMGFKPKALYPDDPEAAYFVPGTMKRLANLRLDSHLKAASQLVKDAGLRTNEVSALVTEVNATRSEPEGLAVIASKRTNGLSARIVRLNNGGNLPPPENPVQVRLTNKAERLSRDLSRIRTAAEAEMTNPEAAARFWSYIVNIEASARRIVGSVIKVTK